MISETSKQLMIELDQSIGELWAHHATLADATDDFLHVIIANGIFSTKIDGFSHAAHMTTPYILAFMQEQDMALNLPAMTQWTESTNSAIRFAHIQVEFHWKIDTRLWQYLLYTKFMRRAYDDAVRASDIEAGDKAAILAAMARFWDEVEVGYCYRFEVIERSRGFAPHPDSTAGAKDHGYAYRELMPAPDYTFDQLKFALIGPEYGAGTSEHLRVPQAWPGISTVERPLLLRVARQWYEDARDAGLADVWLRAKLGDRMVPTRSNGWESGVIECNGFLVGDGPVLAGSDGVSSTAERARLFARSQYCFMLRLSADPADYLTLITTQADALRMLHDESDAVGASEFLRQVEAEFTSLANANQVEADLVDAELEEVLDSTRPIHPRYAAFDPLEPLPWQTRSPERYLARMKRLGYTL